MKKISLFLHSFQNIALAQNAFVQINKTTKKAYHLI